MRRILKKLLLTVFGRAIYEKIQYRYWLKKITSIKNHEPALRLSRRMFQSGDVVLDVGAHFGRYTVPLAQIVGPDGKVFAFEPVDSAYKLLTRIVSQSQLSNVELFNCAMGDGDTAQKMVIPLKDGVEVQSRAALSVGEQSAIDLENNSVQDVECETVDAFVNRAKLTKLSFLKCDVEGAEYLVMKGGQNTLQRFAPVVLLEIESRHTSKFGYTPVEMVQYMKSLGYRVYVVAEGKLSEVSEPSSDCNNYFFVPDGWECSVSDIFL
ncbi:FkbM family methyltransferase [Mariniblastus fucicola]|uniref:Cobalt-precorrin-6Y C(15)-methyltransferase n=1 Tax=Mariniblastus fucicola TaxID=980251 RepID=A0A5B9P1A2_9BACT|nr:FkbM family methyltransferase [Mariniblastus fucicola]QEG20297.1 cobalt-precorrin-6Y C(15)-methyltransferase [Mariniblastus fucicola]